MRLSLASLLCYVRAKNVAHGVKRSSRVLLVSAITFNPCFSDILVTCLANATLCATLRERLYGDDDGDNIVFLREDIKDGRRC